MSTLTPISPSDLDGPPLTQPCGCPEDQSLALSRRTLFRLAGAAGLVTATTLSDAQLAFGAPTGADVLVVLSLRGGFDGLSAIVPAADSEYYKKRGGIAIPQGSLKKADATFGLHPAMKPLYDLWDAGTVGAVHAVGQASPTRSHFAAMEEMERAAPGSSMRSGWIDRSLGTLKNNGAFAAIQVGSPDLPNSFAGPNPEFALSRISSVKLAVGDDLVPLSQWQKSLAGLHKGARPEVSKPLSAAVKAVGTMRKLSATKSDAQAAGYPAGGLGEALHDIARLVKANLGLRFATLDYGDWDMHSNLGSVQAGWFTDRFGQLCTALAAFAKELGKDMDRVTLLTLSEFGRRTEVNGSGGVDHGHGNAVLMLGGGVNGGKVHGKWPTLAPDKLMDGDLAGTTDYRNIVAEVLTKRCGVTSTSAVFPGMKKGTLGVVKAK